MATRTLRTIDLFSGAGGLTSGFVRAGASGQSAFEPVAAVEHDIHAAATYAANHGDHVFAGDIADWLRGDLPEADLVLGGPPCQGFSLLGKRDPDDPRNKLWSHYVDVVSRVRPLAFVLENVAAFLKSAELEQLVAETAPGRRLHGYRLTPQLVDASRHGAPQRRRRAVLIGTRDDVAPFGEVPQLPADRTTTVRDVIRRLPFEVDMRELPQRTTSFQGNDLPGQFRTRELHISRRFTELSLKRFAHVPEGGNRHDITDETLLPNCWKGHTTGSGDVMGRLHWDKPSVTIRTEFFKPEKGRYLHPVAHRAITHREAALLQGFPDDHRWVGTKISIARQIGNAVPVPLGEAIALHVSRSLAAQDSRAA